MNDFVQDMENLINAYDDGWDDYLALCKQLIEKYKLSVEKLQEIRVEELKDFNSKILQAELKNQKLQERCDRYEKALEDIRTNTPIQELLNLPYGCACHEIASEALAAIGGDGCPVGAVGKNGLTKEELEGSGDE